jgi:hypothetical protein
VESTPCSDSKNTTSQVVEAVLIFFLLPYLLLV